MLVIHGTNDRSVPFFVGEDLYARTQPDSELLRVEGGSHMLPITHTELLTRRIIAFADDGLRSNVSPSSSSGDRAIEPGPR